MPRSGVGSKLEEIRANTSAGFQFLNYRFDLLTGRILPTQERWSVLQEKLHFVKNRDSCTVRQFMSLIGLLTATENRVWSGRLYMRPIQWHLKQHWHVPEILEKIIPIPKSLHLHLDWWLDGRNVLRGQTIASTESRVTSVTSIYRCLKQRLGLTLRVLYCKRHVVRHRKSP